jgi:glycerol kinase
VLVDPANASRTLLFDPEALDWSQHLLDVFGMARDHMPRCVPTRHGYGHLRAGQRRIPLTACTGDQSAAAFAFGPPPESVALVNAGTGAFVQRVAPAGVRLPDGLLLSVLRSDASGAIRSHEGTVNGAGSAIDWLAGSVALDIERALPALTAPTAADPPVFMNGVGGLGAPFWKPDFPVEFIGSGDDLQLLASVVESIVFLLSVNLEAMRSVAALQRIVISGGLARCAYLCQALADLNGLVVERYELHEATARGIAFLAAGEPADWTVPDIERSFAPAANRALVARYARWRSEMAQRGAVI